EVVALRVEVPELRREDLLGLELERRVVGGQALGDQGRARDGERHRRTEVRLEVDRRTEGGGDDPADGRLLARVKEHRAARRLYDAVEVWNVVRAVVADDRELFPQLDLVVHEEADVVLGLGLGQVRPGDALEAIRGAYVEVVVDAG